MKESTSTTTITERRFDFTKAEVEALLRREILGGDIQAKVEFIWMEPDVTDAGDVLVIVTNTVTERS